MSVNFEDETENGTPGALLERMADMHIDTEAMAQQLEDRMNFLQDSYDHLNAVSAQVPEAIAKLAAEHKTGVLEAAQMSILTEQEKGEIRKHEETIDFLRKELNSIAQERIVMDVYTRDVHERVKAGSDPISKALLGTRAMNRNDSMNQRTLDKLNGNNYALGKKVESFDGATTGHGRPPTGKMLHTDSNLMSGNSQNNTVNSDGVAAQSHWTDENVTGNVIVDFNMDTPIEELMKPIPIPSYPYTYVDMVGAVPDNAARFKGRKGGSKEGDGQGRGRSSSNGNVANPPHRTKSGSPKPRSTGPPKQSAEVIVRNTNDRLIVPRVKFEMPKEVRNLKNLPVYNQNSKENEVQAIQRKESRKKEKAITSVKNFIRPVARSMRAEVIKSRKEMKTLKDEFIETKRVVNQESLAQRRVIRALAINMDSKMKAQEESIKEEVHDVVSNAFDKLTHALVDMNHNNQLEVLANQQGIEVEDLIQIRKEHAERKELDALRRSMDRTLNTRPDHEDRVVATPRNTRRSPSRGRHDDDSDNDSHGDGHQNKGKHTKHKKHHRGAVSYDIHGHRITTKTHSRGHSRGKRRPKVEYDLHGHRIAHDKEKEPKRGHKSHHDHTEPESEHEGDGMGTIEKQISPRSASTTSPRSPPRSSRSPPRSPGRSGGRGRSNSPARARSNANRDSTTLVPASPDPGTASARGNSVATHREYYVDPKTGNKYRVLTASPTRPIADSGLDPQRMRRSIGTGIGTVGPDGNGTAGEQYKVYQPQSTAMNTGSFRDNQGPFATPGMGGVGGGTVNKNRLLSIDQPLDTPPLNQRQLEIREEEDALAVAQRSGHIQQQMRTEYQLVSTPQGVSWKATSVPINPYVHPDISHHHLDSGGEGAVPSISNILPRPVPGDPLNYKPNRDALDAASHKLDPFSELYDDDDDDDYRDYHAQEAQQHREGMSTNLGIVGGPNDPLIVHGTLSTADRQARAGHGTRFDWNTLGDDGEYEKDDDMRERRSDCILHGPAFTDMPPRSLPTAGHDDKDKQPKLSKIKPAATAEAALLMARAQKLGMEIVHKSEDEVTYPMKADKDREQERELYKMTSTVAPVIDGSDATITATTVGDNGDKAISPLTTKHLQQHNPQPVEGGLGGSLGLVAEGTAKEKALPHFDEDDDQIYSEIGTEEGIEEMVEREASGGHEITLSASADEIAAQRQPEGPRDTAISAIMEGDKKDKEPIVGITTSSGKQRRESLTNEKLPVLQSKIGQKLLEITPDLFSSTPAIDEYESVSDVMNLMNTQGAGTLTPELFEGAGSFGPRNDQLTWAHDYFTSRGWHLRYPLHTAAWQGDLDRVLSLVQQQGYPIESEMEDWYRSTPLQWAASYGQLSVVQALLVLGSNPVVMNTNNPPQNALSMSSKEGHVVVNKWLNIWLERNSGRYFGSHGQSSQTSISTQPSSTNTDAVVADGSANQGAEGNSNKEFLEALVSALRAPVPVPTASSTTSGGDKDDKDNREAVEAAMRRGVEMGIEQGVQRALGSIKKKAQLHRQQQQQDCRIRHSRGTVAKDGEQGVQGGGGREASLSTQMHQEMYGTPASGDIWNDISSKSTPSKHATVHTSQKVHEPSNEPPSSEQNVAKKYLSAHPDRFKDMLGTDIKHNSKEVTKGGNLDSDRMNRTWTPAVDHTHDEVGQASRGSARRDGSRVGGFVPLVSTVIGHSATNEANNLSLSNVLHDMSLSVDDLSGYGDDLSDSYGETVETVFKDVKLAPTTRGRYGVVASSLEVGDIHDKNLQLNTDMNEHRATGTDIHLRVDGDVETSDDWTSVGTNDQPGLGHSQDMDLTMESETALNTEANKSIDGKVDALQDIDDAELPPVVDTMSAMKSYATAVTDGNSNGWKDANPKKSPAKVNRDDLVLDSLETLSDLDT